MLNMRQAEIDYNKYLDLIYGEYRVSSDAEYAEIVINGEKAYQYILNHHGTPVLDAGLGD